MYFVSELYAFGSSFDPLASSCLTAIMTAGRGKNKKTKPDPVFFFSIHSKAILFTDMTQIKMSNHAAALDKLFFF